MKIFKNIALLLSFSFLLGSCNNPEQGGNEQTPPVINDEVELFKTALSKVQNNNITFETDYKIYAFNDKENIEVERHLITVKITEDIYDLKALLMKDGKPTTAISSQIHFEKGVDGLITYRYVDMHNKVITENALDGNKRPIPWEQSVYYNQLNSIDPLLATYDYDEKAYFYDDYGFIENFAHCLVPTSIFEPQLMTITLNEDNISKIHIKEIDDTGVYEGYYFTRSLDTTIKDVGTTQINKIAPFEDKVENEDLRLALEELRTASSFTINSSFLENGLQKEIGESKIDRTNKDVLKLENTPEGTLETYGLHTVNDKLYNFSKDHTTNKLQGALDEVNTFESFIPEFEFSEDIFTLKREEQGYKVYSIPTTYLAILDDIDFSAMYSDTTTTTGKVELFVKDKHLERIEFESVVTPTPGSILDTLYTVRYSNVNSTVIDSSIWNDFEIIK